MNFYELFWIELYEIKPLSNIKVNFKWPVFGSNLKYWSE